MREKLELVRDFAELRAGMIVVDTPCNSCGGTHRGMILGPRPSRGDGEPVFDIVPRPCMGIRYPTVITRLTIATGTVFRVVDPGLENTTDITAAHKIPATKKKRERA